jgi:hypothetical protein
MRKILLAAAAAIVLVCPRAALAQMADIQAAGTLSAQCTTPAAGCSTGQWVTAHIGGRNTISGTITPAVFTGTLACYFSHDSGASFVQGLIRSSVTDQVSQTSSYTTSVAFAASSTASSVSCLDPWGGATDVAIVSTAAVTNTVAVVMTLSASAPRLLDGALSSKGTQSVNSYLGVQQPKDSGRSFVAVDIDSYTLTAADAVMTFSKNVAGTVTGAQTTYAITAGKTLRVQELHCTLRQTSATAASAVVRLRLNTGGACVVGSGLVQSMQLTAPVGTTAAELGTGAPGLIDFPDGFELSGASWQICLSAIGSSANGTLVCGLTGYEY